MRSATRGTEAEDVGAEEDVAAAEVVVGAEDVGAEGDLALFWLASGKDVEAAAEVPAEASADDWAAAVEPVEVTGAGVGAVAVDVPASWLQAASSATSGSAAVGSRRIDGQRR